MTRILHFAFCILLIAAVAACGKKPPAVQPATIKVYETLEVLTPIPVKAEPPAELRAALKFILPVFVAPSDPLASSALTPEGERLLRGLIAQLLGEIEAWRAWAEGR